VGVQVPNDAPEVLVDRVHREDQREDAGAQVGGQVLAAVGGALEELVQRGAVLRGPLPLEVLRGQLRQAGCIVEDLSHDRAPDLLVPGELALDDGDGPVGVDDDEVGRSHAGAELPHRDGLPADPLDEARLLAQESLQLVLVDVAL
jgi:hypothetical protein